MTNPYDTAVGRALVESGKYWPTTDVSGNGSAYAGERPAAFFEAIVQILA